MRIQFTIFVRVENRHLERVGDDYSDGAVFQSLLRRGVRRGRTTALHAKVFSLK